MLEQQSQLQLAEVTTLKKAKMQATRTVEQMQAEEDEAQQAWQHNAMETVAVLRQENQRLQQLHDAAQVVGFSRIDHDFVAADASQYCRNDAPSGNRDVGRLLLVLATPGETMMHQILSLPLHLPG